ncbi:MucR family transcriptional regulator [Sphingobium phenoxybenzoativorans]|uniref:MucR family transcriptional regulator n=1 Tax=Sphingobium phenoxybenzoativorans TaxID=1592790 RepID=A0A975K6B5_9SPHN|nr:MucR family transcriptional regulator [Sphingobium phenoxybenzoativorans]QUT05610.1 MucR family transcriptional regulator [Sphingobium phenoxybenzoativorans]
MADTDQPTFTNLVVQLLSAYVSNNSVASEDLAGLILSTRRALAQDTSIEPGTSAAAGYTPAVTVQESLASQDCIISMIDGKSYKTLKRHLGTHGLTPQDYRERYNLPADYPLVASNYSKKRRAVAARMGLGRNRAKIQLEPVEAPTAPVAKPASTARRKTTTAKVAKAPVKSRETNTSEPATSAAASASPTARKPKLKLNLDKADPAKPAKEAITTSAKAGRRKRETSASNTATEVKTKRARKQKIVHPTAPSVNPIVKKH